MLAFCAVEGVALGAFSKFIDRMYSSPDTGNLVIQAVIGTFAAFAGTLAAYKVFDIKVGAKFRMFVMAAVFGMIGAQPHGARPRHCSATRSACSASAASAWSPRSSVWCSASSC